MLYLSVLTVSRADAGYHQSTIDHASKECGVLVSLFFLYHCIVCVHVPLSIF